MSCQLMCVSFRRKVSRINKDISAGDCVDNAVISFVGKNIAAISRCEHFVWTIMHRSYDIGQMMWEVETSGNFFKSTVVF